MIFHVGVWLYSTATQSNVKANEYLSNITLSNISHIEIIMKLKDKPRAEYNRKIK